MRTAFDVLTPKKENSQTSPQANPQAKVAVIRGFKKQKTFFNEGYHRGDRQEVLRLFSGSRKAKIIGFKKLVSDFEQQFKSAAEKSGFNLLVVHGATPNTSLLTRIIAAGEKHGLGRKFGLVLLPAKNHDINLPDEKGEIVWFNMAGYFVNGEQMALMTTRTLSPRSISLIGNLQTAQLSREELLEARRKQFQGVPKE